MRFRNLAINLYMSASFFVNIPPLYFKSIAVSSWNFKFPSRYNMVTYIDHSLNSSLKIVFCGIKVFYKSDINSFTGSRARVFNLDKLFSITRILSRTRFLSISGIFISQSFQIIIIKFF